MDFGSCSPANLLPGDRGRTTDLIRQTSLRPVFSTPGDRGCTTDLIRQPSFLPGFSTQDGRGQPANDCVNRHYPRTDAHSALSMRTHVLIESVTLETQLALAWANHPTKTHFRPTPGYRQPARPPAIAGSRQSLSDEFEPPPDLLRPSYGAPHCALSRGR